MESNYEPRLILCRANANIQSIAAQLKENNGESELRRLYTSLAVYSKRALRAVSEAAGTSRQAYRETANGRVNIR